MKPHSVPLLVATHLGAVAAGHFFTDTRPIDTEVKQTGYFQTDTKRVLATTVDSLREENQLLVFSYKGTAKVQLDRSWLWLFGAHQELSVPAVVNYYVDLSNLSLADVAYNEAAKLVTVKLPQLTIGDIAFQPENATTINGGLLTFSDSQVEELRKANYASARRAMVAQAQSAGLVSTAKHQAQVDVTNYFEIPLRIAGQPDVRVAAIFP